MAVAGPIDLFDVIGVDPSKSKLYTADVACVADDKNGLYWALRTVDQRANPKQWDIWLIYVANGGAPQLVHHFRQRSELLPKPAGAVTLTIRSDRALILTATVDMKDDALFRPMVWVIDPVV